MKINTLEHTLSENMRTVADQTFFFDWDTNIYKIGFVGKHESDEVMYICFARPISISYLKSTDFLPRRSV